MVPQVSDRCCLRRSPGVLELTIEGFYDLTFIDVPGCACCFCQRSVPVISAVEQLSHSLGRWLFCIATSTCKGFISLSLSVAKTQGKCESLMVCKR